MRLALREPEGAVGSALLPVHLGTLPRVAGLGAVGLAIVAVGLVGVYRYVGNYWLYRGFAPPRDAGYVRVRGASERIYVTSSALGGRRQLVDVYLPPGYGSSPHRRYPVMYLLHGAPGRPDAFIDTVRMGVVEDELLALHRARPMILAMPFGSTGSFTDEEWANGVGRHQAWEAFLSRDVVRAVDDRFRTIRSGRGRVLAGLSEGGYGAVNIGIHHPGEFATIESWSGYMRADDLGVIFGHRRSLLARNTPLETLAPAAPKLRRAHTYFWFYSGTDDPFRAQNAAFARKLSAFGILHRFFLVRGGHNWALWRGNAARAYLAASRRLARA
jgi:enterochelin esterase-like enzyme